MGQKTLVDLAGKRAGEVELPQLDLTPYIGRKVKIEKVEECQSDTGYYIQVSTEPLAKFGDKEIRATKNFGLVETEDGRVGWASKGKLATFLRRMKCSDYMQLVGKEVIVQAQYNEKAGREYLTFRE